MYNQYDPNVWGRNSTWNTNMGVPNMTPKHRFNWNNILNNTQRTLGIINQAIPLVYQMRPLIRNAKTIFKIAGAMNDRSDEGKEPPKTKTPKESIKKEKDSSLQFFL